MTSKAWYPSLPQSTPQSICLSIFQYTEDQGRLCEDSAALRMSSGKNLYFAFKKGSDPMWYSTPRGPSPEIGNNGGGAVKLSSAQNGKVCQPIILKAAAT